MSTCAVNDCEMPVQARGWCRTHYHRARHRGGDPLGTPPRFQPKACTIDGCDREHHALGWCRLHWRRARENGGDPQPDRPLRGDLAPDGRKWCTGCDLLRQPHEFSAGAHRRDGLAGHCRACQRRYREENRARLLEGKRRYYRENIEQAKAAAARWREQNAERNRQIAAAATLAYRARKAAAPGTTTPDQLAARWDYYGGRCWMCGDDATETDHVKPLSKGGSNWPANLRPACKPCNQGKSGRWPLAA